MSEQDPTAETPAPDNVITFPPRRPSTTPEELQAGLEFAARHGCEVGEERTESGDAWLFVQRHPNIGNSIIDRREDGRLHVDDPWNEESGSFDSIGEALTAALSAAEGRGLRGPAAA
ncbi:hypothetical protein M0638_07235 [Roseomonas sp. NAR14]|uniref:Uncharacterized protein n=1 Tax=Roseomonas acroporae TaxID=2937791 RepID=A0A9X2BT19_9PROT|nr:hypothetical protein [Roseomonas acroporae]MCK8784168.1 hypothetical protein [Roseomonas acroporae]